MKKNNKIISKIAIILLILISIFALYNIHNSTAFRLDEVLLRDCSSNSSMFAIMVENDDGEYEQYTDSTSWPTNMSFNEELSYCTDINGNYLTSDTLSFSNGYGTVTGSDTAFCFLYFDLHNLLYETILLSENNSSSIDAAITYIKSKGTPDFNTTTKISYSSLYSDDWGLYYAEDDYGDSFYFRGDETTNNYIYFAGYLWRIVRLNGDNSVRIMYYGDDIYSPFSELGGNNALIGYMHGDAYTNNSSSSETTLTLQKYYYYYSSSYTFDESTGTYTLGDDATQQVWNSSLVGYFTCRSTSTSCSYLYEVISYEDIETGITHGYSRTSSTDDDGNTIYSIKQSTNNVSSTFATMYYYATSYDYDPSYGYVLKNYDYYVYDGTDTLKGYFTCASTNATCGTLYYIESADSSTVASVTKYSLTTNNYSTTHKNKYNSTIKDIIDEWYISNILNETDGNYSYSKYLSDTLFCNDRSLSSGTGTGSSSTQYAAYERLSYSAYSPILTCPQIDDAFTVDDTEYGNGSLTYPIALITADELVMNGIVFTYDTSGHAGDTYYYWTMTPSKTDYVFISRYDFFLNSDSITNYINDSTYYVIRPVVNLSTSVRVVSGDGTMDNPYEITIY